MSVGGLFQERGAREAVGSLRITIIRRPQVERGRMLSLWTDTDVP